jgi:hypothetical protein
VRVGGRAQGVGWPAGAYHVSRVPPASLWLGALPPTRVPTHPHSPPMPARLPPAGKSHTLRYLHAAGAFPLDRFVWVDPDRVKSALPDMAAYIAHNRPQAGVLTHKESAFIAEIIELEALKQSKCVLVDGSLRNRDWYARWFGRVRADFPAHRLAILLVTASRERVYDRARRRAAITAREVPRDVLDEAIEQVPRSFSALSPLADYSAVLDNDDDAAPPTFRPPHTLASFSAVWADLRAVAPATEAGKGAAGAGAGGGSGSGSPVAAPGEAASREGGAAASGAGAMPAAGL